jgi:hypothetical protein
MNGEHWRLFLACAYTCIIARLTSYTLYRKIISARRQVACNISLSYHHALPMGDWKIALIILNITLKFRWAATLSIYYCLVSMAFYSIMPFYRIFIQLHTVPRSISKPYQPAVPVRTIIQILIKARPQKCKSPRPAHKLPPRLTPYQGNAQNWAGWWFIFIALPFIDTDYDLPATDN